MRKVRPTVKSPRKTKAKAAGPELSAEEVTAIEQISQRCEQSESAWQRMNAAPGGDETWSQVEEHLLERGGQDSERRWKYFSK